ncbi:MAG: hypothetical protein WCK89_16835 [bacterium]
MATCFILNALPVAFYGPVYKAHAADGGKLVIRFDHVGKGLTVAKGGVAGKPQGFALAGEDGKYVWADATVEGDTVVLASDKVAKPVAARYAWSGSHRWANLFNKDGLPAPPFRTDAPAKSYTGHDEVADIGLFNQHLSEGSR